MSTVLPDAKIYRGGVTARQVNLETFHAEVSSLKPGNGVRNTFQLSSKGGGTIQVWFEYGSRSYEAQLRAMVQNDRSAALATMSKILAEEMSQASNREAAIVRGARAQLVDLAETERRNADGTDEAIAMIVSEKLRE